MSFNELGACELLLTCQCLPSGFPSPRVYWFKDGRPLHASDKTVVSSERDVYSLEIVDVKREDSGEYSAYISNSAGSAYSSARMIILGKYDGVDIVQ